MSWCGGGEISVTPGVECRVRAMTASTLCPGSWPPSPGFAPCEILIWSSSALTMYSAVTPNRADATCLIALLRSVPKRAGSSPPSPLLLRPPSRFMAMASVSCASALRDPNDIAPVQNRRVTARLVVRELAELLERRVVVAARRVLELGDRQRIPVVVLALNPVLVLASG